MERIEQPGDRFWCGWATALARGSDRARRACARRGILRGGAARRAQTWKRSASAAWDEMEPLRFATFAVRAKRSDKTFPHPTMEIESAVGRHLLEKLRAEGRDVRVQLKEPELTCHIEITPGPLLVYARKIPGAGGLPANTAGRITCLLSGGFDSAVAAYHMMKRGAHLSFVHFYGTGARPGESSLHVASALARQLMPYQFHAKLYRVPFEAIQREIVRYAPEDVRILLYRRMMLRIAEAICEARPRAGAGHRRQPGPGGLANAAESRRGGRSRAHAGVSAAGRHRQNGYSRDGAQDRHVRYFFRAVSRLLPGFPAALPGALPARKSLADAEAKSGRSGASYEGVRGATLSSFEYKGGEMRK